MDRKTAERFTSPAIGVAVIAAAILIVVDPRQALLVLCGAELVVGAGCAGHVRTSLRLSPPAPPSAVLFAMLALFWLGMAALSVWWYFGGQ